jgi:hypothetical protein
VKASAATVVFFRKSRLPTLYFFILLCFKCIVILIDNQVSGISREVSGNGFNKWFKLIILQFACFMIKIQIEEVLFLEKLFIVSGALKRVSPH